MCNMLRGVVVSKYLNQVDLHLRKGAHNNSKPYSSK